MHSPSLICLRRTEREKADISTVDSLMSSRRRSTSTRPLRSPLRRPRPMTEFTTRIIKGCYLLSHGGWPQARVMGLSATVAPCTTASTKGKGQPWTVTVRTLLSCPVSGHYRPVSSSSWNERRRFTISFDILTIGRLWLEEWRMRAHDSSFGC
jgi:hypothetical protein